MRKLVLGIVLSCIVVSALLGGVGVAFAADETTYSSVLDDLAKDENFDVNKYPEIPGSQNVEVISIAESNDGYLLIYTYQPGGELVTCSAISISQAINDNAKWSRFELRLLSREGTLAKYCVEGLDILTDVLRYYDISTIYRPGNDGDQSDPGVGVNEVAIPVAKRYSAATIDGEVSYSVQDTEVFEVKPEDMFVGSLFYFNGIEEWTVLSPLVVTYLKMYGATSNFVAFRSPYPIDELCEADVEFTVSGYSAKGLWINDIIACSKGEKNLSDYLSADGTSSKQTVTLSANETVSSDSHWFGTKYNWTRYEISTADYFCSTENLTDTTKDKMKNMQWVLRFYESSAVSELLPLYFCNFHQEKVSDVAVLRLKFKRNGTTYNLGVVSNVVTDTDGSDGVIVDPWENFVAQWNTFWNKAGNWLSRYWWVLLIVVVVIVLGVLSAYFPWLRVGLVNGLKVVGKGLWYIVSAPARLLVLISEKVKERKGGT